MVDLGHRMVICGYFQGFPSALQIEIHIIGINLIFIFLVKWKLTYYLRDSIFKHFWAKTTLGHKWRPQNVMVLLGYCVDTKIFFMKLNGRHFCKYLHIYNLFQKKCILGIAHSNHYLLKCKNKILTFYYLIDNYYHVWRKTGLDFGHAPCWPCFFLHSVLKGYLRYKTVLCHKVGLDV